MWRSSKSTRSAKILERPKGKFSIEEEFLTPSSSSYRSNRASASSTLARVQAFTSKLSTSTSALDSDSEYLLEEPSSRSVDFEINEVELMSKSKSLGKLDEKFPSSLPGSSEFNNDALSMNTISGGSKHTFERGNIRFGEILAPRTIHPALAAQKSQSTCDLREQRPTTTVRTLPGSRSQCSSTFDLRSRDSNSLGIVAAKPTPLPRTSLNSTSNSLGGSRHGMGAASLNNNSAASWENSEVASSMSTAFANRSRPLIDSQSSSRSTPNDDYPADKNPFSSFPQPTSLLRPPASITSARRTHSEFGSLSKFDANISSNPSRIFDRKPPPPGADPYSDEPGPPTYSSVASYRARERTTQGPTQPSYLERSAEANNTDLVSVRPAWPTPEVRVSGRTDLYSSAEKRLLRRTCKNQAPPPPLTKPNEEDKADPPQKLHRALTDFQYSFPQSTDSQGTSRPMSNYLYYRPEIDKLPGYNLARVTYDSKQDLVAPTDEVSARISLISLENDDTRPKQGEKPPPLPSCPPPDDSPEKSERKTAEAAVNTSFSRWRDRIFSSKEPAPLIELARDKEVESTSSEIITNALRIPSKKKLAPTPSERRILETDSRYEFSDPSREVLSTYRGVGSALLLERKNERSTLSQDDSQRNARSTTPGLEVPAEETRPSPTRSLFDAAASSENAMGGRFPAPVSPNSTTPQAVRPQPKPDEHLSESKQPPSIESLFERGTPNGLWILPGTIKSPSSDKFFLHQGSRSRSLPRLPSSSAPRTNAFGASDPKNPFTPSEDEDSLEHKIFDRLSTDSPPQASTPYGTLKKKFGGSGLAQAWNNESSNPASGAQSLTSLNTSSYPEGANPFEESAESVSSLSTDEEQREDESYNPFFGDMSEDDEAAGQVEETPKPPPRKIRTLSRSSASLSSISVTRNDAQEPSEETAAGASVEEKLNLSEDTVGGSEADGSIELNLSQPLPPLPALPGRRGENDSSESVPPPPGRLSEEAETTHRQESAHAPVSAIGKLGASDFRKPAKERSVKLIDVNARETSSRQCARVVTPGSCGLDTQEVSRQERDAAELSEESWSPDTGEPIGPDQGAVSKVKTRKKTTKLRPRRQRKIRPRRKSRPIVIQYIYNTPLCEPASLPKPETVDDRSRACAATSSQLLVEPSGPSSSVGSVRSASIGQRSGSALDDARTPGPTSAHMVHLRPIPSVDRTAIGKVVSQQQGSGLRAAEQTGETSNFEYSPNQAPIASRDIVPGQPSAVFGGSPKVLERQDSPEIESSSDTSDGSPGHAEIPPRFSIEEVEIRTGKEGQGSPVGEEEFNCESSSTSGTSYDSDLEDPDITISSIDLSTRWNKRALSTIFEYSEEESSEAKVPGGAADSDTRDDGLIFVESMPEDGDDFQVHSVVHDDLGSSSEDNSDTFEMEDGDTRHPRQGTAVSGSEADSGNARRNSPKDVDLARGHISEQTQPVRDETGVREFSPTVRFEEQTGNELTRVHDSSWRVQLEENQPDPHRREPATIETEATGVNDIVARSEYTETVGDIPTRQQLVLTPAVETESRGAYTDPADVHPTKASYAVSAANEGEAREASIACQLAETSHNAENETVPERISVIPARPQTLSLEEARSGSSKTEHDLLNRQENSQGEFPDRTNLDRDAALKRLHETAQIENSPVSTPIEIIETPVAPQALSHLLVGGVRTGSGEPEEVGTFLVPRTLPLPPVDLISRRYSEGDANSAEKSLSHREFSRRNSVSPLAETSFVTIDLDEPDPSPRGKDDSTTRAPPPTGAKKGQKAITRPGVAPPKPPAKDKKASGRRAPPPPPAPQPSSSRGRKSTSIETPSQTKRAKSLSERFAEAQTQRIVLPELSAQSGHQICFVPLAVSPTPTRSPGTPPARVAHRRPAPAVPAPRDQEQRAKVIVSKRSTIADIQFKPLPSLEDITIVAKTEAALSREERTHVKTLADVDTGLDSPTMASVGGDDTREERDLPEATVVDPHSNSDEERRSSNSSLAERIFGRTMSCAEEDEKLLIQCREIEEQQANLSAEARIVERQLYEATKESALRCDLPRLELNQETGKYRVANEIYLGILPETLVKDLYRILNVKNLLAGKHKQITFLRSYNQLQREQAEVEAKLRNLGKNNDGSQADADFERALISKLIEIVEQRDKLVGAMDGDNRRKKTLGEFSQSADDVSNESLVSSASIRSSKSLTTLHKGVSKSRRGKSKRKGVRHFIKKRYKRVFA